MLNYDALLREWHVLRENVWRVETELDALWPFRTHEDVDTVTRRLIRRRGRLLAALERVDLALDDLEQAPQSHQLALF